MKKQQPEVSDWVRSEIQSLSAYQVADAQGLVKLDAMENPYTWTEDLRSAWLERLRRVDVNRYPDPVGCGLKQCLRAHMNIPHDAEILLGNGSDELIQMIAMTLAQPDKVVMSVEPAFVMYRMISVFTGMRYHGVALKGADFALDLAGFLAAIAQHQPAVVFIAYPNNPTGNLFAEQELIEVLDAAPGLVVIDEAYAPFTQASFLDRVGRFSNLLVMRTMSKMGFAGLRLGFLVGPRAWLAEIDKTRLPYNVNTLTQVSVEFALSHADVFARQAEAIVAHRGELFERLSAISGIKVFPSHANFILFRVPQGQAEAVHKSLRAQGVLIKSLHRSHPLLQDCLRVTVGKPDENQAFLKALVSALTQAK